MSPWLLLSPRLFLSLAHLALCAALMLANPAAEMRRLGAIEITFWPRVRAQRALCAAPILARAAALIVRRPRFAPVLFNPLSALIAVSRALTCCAALSRSAFNCAIMSMCSPRARIVTGDQANALWSRVYQMWKWRAFRMPSSIDVKPGYRKRNVAVA